jgi:hypothetical protein
MRSGRELGHVVDENIQLARRFIITLIYASTENSFVE